MDQSRIMSRLSARGRAGREKKAGIYVRAAASYLGAGACLFWVFHDIHLHEFLTAMTRIQWLLLLLCIFLEFVTYFCVAWEWQLLLRPAGALSLRRTMQSVLAGRFANDALPLQTGYLVRATLAARWMGVSMISVFPSLIIERLWDGIWLAAGIGLAALLLPLPPAVLHAASLFGGIVLAGTGMTVFLILRRSRASSQSVQPPAERFQRIRFAIRHLSDGMRDVGRFGLLMPVVGLSVLKLVVQAAAFLVLLRAYNFHLPVAVGMAVFLVGYLGICVPSTPAGTGMFQMFVVAGLTLFGISKSVAASFALVAFVIITVPLAIAGFFALAQSGVRLGKVKSQIRQLNVSD